MGVFTFNIDRLCIERLIQPEVEKNMAVKIRLARFGSKKKPFYRIVAANSQAKRDGRFLEVVGTYDPRNKISGLKLDTAKMQAWAEKGAEFTPTAAKLWRRSLAEQNPSE